MSTVLMSKADLDAVSRASERARRERQALTRARRDLIEAMRQAHRNGESLASIGGAAGISRQRVYELISASE